MRGGCVAAKRSGRSMMGHVPKVYSATPHRPKVDAKKAAILEYLRAGTTIAEACERVGVSYESYRYYKRTDSQFALTADSIQGKKAEGKPQRDDVPDFPEFCE